MNVLVTDGQERPALAIVRSLGQRGIRAWVGSEARSSLAGSSRYCSRSISYPSPQREPDQFSEWLLALVERERIDVVIPVSDVTTHCVIRQQTALRSQAAVAVPPVDAFERVTDKAQLLNLALISGVPVPKTVVIERGHDLEKAAADIQFPVVVKSFRSRIPSDQGWIGTTVHYAGSAQDLERLYQDNGYLATFPSLIQQRVVGPGVGVFALFDRGRLVTTFAQRRLREKPPSGGVSVLRESVPSDPELVDYTNRLLGPLGWHGVAMVEFKRDQESGRPFLIEVNGRFWGSLQLAVDSGVDFPFLVCQLARGQELDVPATYRVGIRSRWLLGDLDHLMLRLFRRERDQDLPAGTPSRWRTAVDFLQFTGRDLKYEVLRLDDPRPFVYEARRYAGDAARAFRRAARRRMPRWPNVQPRAVRTQKGNRHARAVR